MPTANPFLGVVFHWLGGLAAGSFYTPYRYVRRWSWEVFWLAGGVFSWIVAPWAMASILVPDLVSILADAPTRAMSLTLLFGALWGVGGLTFGLSMRYLGLSLGYAVALGLCSAFGTLIPPIAGGDFQAKLLETASGRVVLLGVGVCLAGIAISGLAGVSKERELDAEAKKASVTEFNFAKGVVVAVFAGIMSACMAFALAAAEPIKALAVQHGTGELWQGLPALIVALLGGFATNCVWCVALMVRNRTLSQYVGAGEPAAVSDPAERTPLLRNYLLCALAGVTWYLQFFFYSMGESQMGDLKFSSWTIHMASIIIFSTLWGIGLREWRGTSVRTKTLLFAGLLILVASTVVVGYGNYLGRQG